MSLSREETVWLQAVCAGISTQEYKAVKNADECLKLFKERFPTERTVTLPDADSLPTGTTFTVKESAGANQESKINEGMISYENGTPVSVWIENVEYSLSQKLPNNCDKVLVSREDLAKAYNQAYNITTSELPFDDLCKALGLK